MAEYEQYLDDLITHLKKRGLLDAPLEAAFRAAPRHLFMPDDAPLEQAYADEAQPIKRAKDGSWISSASQPSMIALMLRQLDLRPGHNVLEIGAGTGYNAALMQHIVGRGGRITSVELEKDLAQLAENNLARAGAYAATVVHGDGAMGYAPRASYDRIVSTVSVWDVPEMWARQLKDDGILVAPLMLDGGVQFSAAFVWSDGRILISKDNVPCGFVPLRGAAAGPNVYKRVGSTNLTIAVDDDSLDTAALHSLLSADHEPCNLGIALSPNDYWGGLLPFLMLNPPRGFHFVTYRNTENLQAYGIEEGSGFGLLSAGSACFVPFDSSGATHCFAGSDAFIALMEVAEAWDSAGRPSSDNLRIRLLPRRQDAPTVTRGKVYWRREHYIHVWIDG